MKVYLHFLILFLSPVFLLISGEYKTSRKHEIKKGIISCQPGTVNGTLSAYMSEASTSFFAAMHTEPLPFVYDQQQGKMITLAVADGNVANAYYIPSVKPSNRWLIVIQEWWGLNDHIKAEADRYHQDLPNMNVLAIDMYDGKVASTPDSAMKLVRGADPIRMTSIVQGAISHAGSDASIYSVGWCFGGMWSLQTAILAGKNGKGTVMFYGRPETNMDKLRSIQCDVLGFFGNLDRSPTPQMVSEFEKNMQDAGKKLTTYKYEAGHGFANPSNPSYNVVASEDSYRKAIEFFKQH
jgi:carboxymethylenebutenolidase